MDLDERLRNVAVVGAAGKMGRGIALLLAREALRIIARESSGREGAEGASGTPRLSLIDPARAAHHGLVEYIMRHTVAQALGDAPGDDGPRDGDREREALERLLSLSTDLDGARGAKLVFEAAPENLRLKADLLRDLRGLCPEDAIFLTNTSSIPIHVLEEESGLRGRIIGFHFYNPPAVQRLLELITTDSTPSEIDELGVRLAERLGKLVVRSADVAGFIGNGHFIREGAYALARAREIADGGLGFEGAVRAIDIVTREALLRPMGIFQLIDYVGIDVFAAIADVMSDHLEGEDLRHPLLDRMLASRRRGGQDPTGAQTDGFLRYEDG
ncbi:MAG TPA: 3-hydroxyacyl-CoA dehydrogenase family protein, partial [Planctomycetota bacterium]|nr:3-hydroxyacyl-CoA dehydrogenase family protein [Planctomycetota bacterium]